MNKYKTTNTMTFQARTSILEDKDDNNEVE